MPMTQLLDSSCRKCRRPHPLISGNAGSEKWIPIAIQAYQCPACHHRNDLRKRRGWSDYLNASTINQYAETKINEP